MRVLPNYHHFDGLPWATGYLVNALAYQGVTAPHTGQPYTEALLMGVNGGISAGYFAFEYEGWDPHLHFLTRYLFDEQPGAVFERLRIPMETQQTANPQKGVANVLNALAQGKPAIVWVDVMSLPYASAVPQEGYWLVMPLLVYGYDLDADRVSIADRARVPLYSTIAEFAAARQRLNKTRQRMMTIGEPDPNQLPNAVRAGIRACIDILLNDPPVGHKSSFGLDAFTKWARLLESPRDKKGWAKMFAPPGKFYAGLTSAYKYIELWYTGGTGARHIYADFLDEAAQLLERDDLRAVADLYRATVPRWRALTAALLPDSVPLLRETRDLMVRDYELFVTQGNDSVTERRAIDRRLGELRVEANHSFPLTNDEAADMRLHLRDLVLQLHDAERDAITALAALDLGQPSPVPMR